MNYEELIKKMVENELNKDLNPKRDSDIKECKICLIKKKRTLLGTFDGINRKWADEDGSLWNGRVCGSCHRNKMKNHMKIKRAPKNG